MNKRAGLFLVLAALAATPASAGPWDAVDAAFGRSGVDQAQGVRRYSFPRSDLTVTLDGVGVKPALALGSWIAFQPHGKETVVMGDLVLLHEEVNPVLSRLLASGLTITALHNHLPGAIRAPCTCTFTVMVILRASLPLSARQLI